MQRRLKGIDPYEFEKGHSYINKVRIVEEHPTIVVAFVKGSAAYPYGIYLMRDDVNREVRGDCTCPAFERYGECKHIAAVILSGKAEIFKNLDSSYHFVANDESLLDVEEDDYEDNYEDNYNNPYFGGARKFIDFPQFYDHFQNLLGKNKKEKVKEVEKFYQDNTKEVSHLPHSIWYALHFIYLGNELTVRFLIQCQSLLKSGKLGKIKKIKIDNEIIKYLPHLEDQNILTQLSAHANWEHNFQKGNSCFEQGKISIQENKNLFLNILKTGRALHMIDYYRYHHEDSSPLSLSDDTVKIFLEVDSSAKILTAKLALKNTVLNLFENKDYEYFHNERLLLMNGVFYCVEEESLGDELIQMLEKLQDTDYMATDESWEKLKELIVAHVPHNLIQGDRFNLESVKVELDFQVYLRWEEGTQLVRAMVLEQFENFDSNKLYDFDRQKIKSLYQFLEDHNIEVQYSENAFIFQTDFTYPLCRYLEEFGVEVYLKNTKVKTASNFNLKVSSGINWLELDPKLEFNEEQVDFSKVLRSLDLSNNSIGLGKNAIGILPEKWLQQIKKLQQNSVLAKGKYQLHPAKALLLEEFNAENLPDEVIQLKKNLKEFKTIGPVPEVANFLGKLRPYQQLSLGWFDFLERCNFGGCLADDMGLGKTVQVIAWLAHKFQNNKKLKVLVLSPKSLTFNWKEELNKFFPSLHVYRWDRGELSELAYQTSNVVLVSYQLLQRQNNFEYEFDNLILDEAQVVKNPKSLTNKAVSQIKARHKLALTGTPVENHSGDLMSIFNIVMPGLFQSKNIKNPNALNDFSFIQPFILRRTKEEVLKELPEKNIQTIYCEQSPKEQKHYLAIHNALKNQIENEDITNNKFNFLQILTKLRQAACHLSLVDQSLKVKSSKLEMLKELVADIHESDSKVIIFSQFTRLLKLAQLDLGLDSTNSCYLDGRTGNRQKVVDQFKSSKDHRTFFVSIKAGGVGLNLTNANYCIILDPWWNPAVESQAIDRIHRIGQENRVFAYRLITKNSIEEKVSLLQAKKRELYEKILNSNEGFIRGLSKTDVEFLLDT